MPHSERSTPASGANGLVRDQVGARTIPVPVVLGKFTVVYHAANHDAESVRIPESDREVMDLLYERGVDTLVVSDPTGNRLSNALEDGNAASSRVQITRPRSSRVIGVPLGSTIPAYTALTDLVVHRSPAGDGRHDYGVTGVLRDGSNATGMLFLSRREAMQLGTTLIARAREAARDARTRNPRGFGGTVAPGNTGWPE